MNQPYSKINFIKKEIHRKINFDNIKDTIYKRDDLYRLENGELVKYDTAYSHSKNIFSTYSTEIYNLYLDISDMLDEVCREYDIAKDFQKYRIYGKIVEYGKSTNTLWYDFPGIDRPHLHGFFFFNNKYKISFKNNDQLESVDIDKNTIIINKPTDLINIKTEIDCCGIEFYIFPNIMLKHNEPGVWVPIL
jgi:hypothetical protein